MDLALINVIKDTFKDAENDVEICLFSGNKMKNNGDVKSIIYVKKRKSEPNKKR